MITVEELKRNFPKTKYLQGIIHEFIDNEVNAAKEKHINQISLSSLFYNFTQKHSSLSATTFGVWIHIIRNYHHLKIND